MNSEHKFLRKVETWGTFGKSGTDPLKFILIKDIHDDHLESIIDMLMGRGEYRATITNIMRDEQEYRRINKIHIPFKFGK